MRDRAVWAGAVAARGHSGEVIAVDHSPAARPTSHSPSDDGDCSLAAMRLFPALAERNIRVYAVGQIASVIGAWVVDIVLNLLTWELSKSPALLGLVNFLLFAPLIVFPPLLSRRVHPRNVHRVMCIVLTAGATTAVALTGLAFANLLTLPLVLGFAATRGLFNGIEMPARHMFISTLVSNPTCIGGAIAVNSLVYQVARMLGPAAGATLFGTGGPVWGFAAGAAGFLVMLAFVARLRVDSQRLQESVDMEPLGMRRAVAYVRQHRFGSVFLPISIAVGAFAGTYQTLVPVLADRVYGNAQLWTGAFLTAAGAGALSGAVLLSSHYMLPLIRRISVPTPWIVAASLFCAGQTRHALLAVMFFFMIGLFITVASTGTNAVLQNSVPNDLRGAVTGLYLSTYVGTLPLSQLLGGALAQHMAVETAFSAMAAGLLMGSLVIYVPRWIKLGRIEIDADRI